ncbi:hypothetical protein AOLI_G00246300 [Acnodon oligacanthus]
MEVIGTPGFNDLDGSVPQPDCEALCVTMLLGLSVMSEWNLSTSYTHAVQSSILRICTFLSELLKDHAFNASEPSGALFSLGEASKVVHTPAF